MLEEHKMKKKVNESHLRSIIRGVIQEMFDEDLHEGENLGMDEKGEADEEMAQAGAAAATRDKAPYEVGGEGLAEDLQSTKGHFSDEDPGTVDYNEDEPEGGLDEDSEGEETEHYGEAEGEDHKEEESMEDHVAAIDRHLGALKRDMGYDESHEYRDEEGEHFRESLGLDEEQYAQLLEEYGPMDEGFRDWARAARAPALAVGRGAQALARGVGAAGTAAGEWAKTKGVDKAKKFGRGLSRGAADTAGALARSKLGQKLDMDSVTDFGRHTLTRRNARKAARSQNRKEKATAACQQDCNDQADSGLSQGAEQACLTQCDTMTESFFPKGHDIREIARYETYSGLMKKWGYTKKEK